MTRAWLVPPIVMLGAIASRIVLTHAPSRIATDLAQPLPIATAWGGYGLTLWFVLLATLCALVVVYRGLLRERGGSIVQLVSALSLTLVVGLWWLPLLSSDIYAYASYGEMARLGANPYHHHPELAHNAIVSAANWQWSGIAPICVYGPAFVAIAASLAWLMPTTSVLAHLDAMRIVSMLALCGCVVSLARWRGVESARAFGLHPLALWAAIEGHNDTWMLCALFASATLARNRAFLARALVVLAATIKLPALAVAVVSDVALTRRRSFATSLIGIGVTLAVVGVAYVPLLVGARDGFAAHARYAPSASVQALGWPIAVAIAALVVARLRAFSGTNRWCALALVAWLAIANPYPWYALWLLALVPFATDRQVRIALWTVSGVSFLRYLPDVVGTPNALVSIALGLAATIAYLPLLRRAIMTRP